MSDRQPNETEHETLEDWWEAEPDVTLTRSDWSVLLETVSEMAQMDSYGDHVDQIAAREKRKLVSKVRTQAEIEPPVELTRAQYHDTEADS